ncbi:MAG: hypothetical protein U5K37_01225 [Natrialbaceae archaeon]|nr:hypothetical protein [Natrialbaceae archaeon]
MIGANGYQNMVMVEEHEPIIGGPWTLQDVWLVAVTGAVVLPIGIAIVILIRWFRADRSDGPVRLA